ncbi:amidase (plasmid) [Nocardioides sp. R1-1]|uniref:amidase n=1 Tax=Nocardioides sp. R1-1 TaxID=3383502 RepID=UPI0038CFFE51
MKDVIDVAGLPTRNGTPGATWRSPDRSATVWRLLAEEGAECVGKAATHELAWGVTTATVPHPMDPGRMPGGSSGGSAACVAAGVADAALGTDTGGSIRIPASLCGVVGLRPTTGTVPSHGISPLAPTQDVAGPIGHDVATCAAVGEVLLGRPLGRSETSLGRIGVLANPGPLDRATAEVWRQAVAGLRDSGAEIVEVDAAPLRLAGAVSLLTMLWESAQAYATAVADDPSGFGGEARALATLGVALADDIAALGAARRALRAETARMFVQHELDAVLTPTTACIAPRRAASTVTLDGREVPVATALTRYTGWAAATGLPAVSVPAGTPGALPVGAQVMAPPGDEATCLTVARAIEDDVRRRSA